MNAGRNLIVATLAVFMLLAAGCSGEPLSTREKGALFGTVLGAGSGAIIGSAVGHPAAGAAIGGGLGLVTGGVIGNSLQNQEIQQRYTEARVSRQQREIEHQRREIQGLRSGEYSSHRYHRPRYRRHYYSSRRYQTE